MHLKNVLNQKILIFPSEKKPITKAKEQNPQNFCDFINFNFVIEWIIPSQIPKYMS